MMLMMMITFLFVSDDRVAVALYHVALARSYTGIFEDSARVVGCAVLCGGHQRIHYVQHPQILSPVVVPSRPERV